jgi:hypothetical protein
MSGIRVASGKELIEPVLGLRENGLGNRHSDPSKPRGADRDEKSGDRLNATREILETLADEVARREALEVHRHMIAA